MESKVLPESRRLAASAYNSPYDRAGAPPNPNGNDYAELRQKALEKLGAMGFEAQSMVERGVVWAEDQDPFGHVMQSRYMQFLGTCFHRVMESYDQFLSDEEYNDMVRGKTVAPMIRQFDLNIYKQVQYPDSLISAYRQDRIEPTRNNGTTCLFSLKQQAIVADVKGSAVYVDVKTGRPVDIRSLPGGWPSLFEGFQQKSEQAAALKEKWEAENPPKRAQQSNSKI